MHEYLFRPSPHACRIHTRSHIAGSSQTVGGDSALGHSFSPSDGSNAVTLSLCSQLSELGRVSRQAPFCLFGEVVQRCYGVYARGLHDTFDSCTLVRRVRLRPSLFT